MLWLLLCCALWGLNQVSIKVVLPEVPSLVQLALRSVIAATLVLGWMRLRGQRWSLRQERASGCWWPGLLAGALFTLEFAMVFVGLQHTTAARSVVFINTSPFIVALLLALMLPAERLRPVQVSGLVLAFVAIAWAFGEGFGAAHEAGSRWWMGDALILGAAALWGLTTVVIRLSALKQAPAESILAYQLGVSAVLAPLAALLSGEAWPAQWSGLAIGSILYQGVVVSFASYLLWFWLLTRYPATQVQAFVFLSPVFGTVLAGLLLGETVTPRLIVALVGVGLGLSLLGRRQRP
ncbi:drug/metabolite transporter (DMT)-like permease [Sphaerotilus hippei]|uniref:Drug/metabolite transporter (DMT)-like permease n=1 Tax=Sphaerotilus hippei TaxID=744406 RepID=A0A318H1I2_9BURK|nr:DMT family transporter [Sphaerotilus hippei]PXW96995.1 drug/metabolite transporter (DMT)-like permease [Sphaerotilus hippei]